MTHDTRGPASPGGAGDRVRALGAQLVEVHQWLRSELVRLREEISAYGDGDLSQDPVPLRAHCTAFCSALTRHHTSEDDTAFPALGEHFPDLIPVLEELRRDHGLVADILRQLEQLVATLTPDTTEWTLRELDGLAAVLSSHFQWEERRLVGAFDGLETPDMSEDLFGVTAT